MGTIEKKYGYKKLEDLFEQLESTETLLGNYITSGNEISWTSNIYIANDHFILEVTITTG